MSSDCLACGHSVVAWCPDDSSNKDDLVCYNCGLHANSEAAQKIAALQADLKSAQKQTSRLQVENDSLREDCGEFNTLVEALQAELAGLREAVGAYRQALIDNRTHRRIIELRGVMFDTAGVNRPLPAPPTGSENND